MTIATLALLAPLFLPLQAGGQGGGPGGGGGITYNQRVLTPGSGWTGPTAEPGAVGSGPGVDAKCITRWDVVPYQEFDGDFEVGVVAFHINGIDRVEFSVDDGPWKSIDADDHDLNPRTGVYEFWVVLRESKFASAGAIEVRATAYPEVGEPRLLPSLFLYCDPTRSITPIVKYASPTGSDSTGDGSQGNPYQTMWRAAKAISDQAGSADGGVVYLEAGNYSYGPPGFPAINTQDRWVTFKPAPGVAKSAVVVNNSSNPGLKTKLVRLDGITVSKLLYADSSLEDYLWVDSCDVKGGGQETSVHAVGWFTGWTDEYFTGCTVSDNQLGPQNASMVRQTTIERIGEDALGGAGLVIDCVVDDIDRGSQGSWHPDVYDFWNPAFTDNIIIYGLKVTNAQGQGIYGGHGNGSVNNSAIINVLMEIGPGTWLSQWEIPTNHLLIWNCSFVEHRWNWRTPESTLTNISVRGCTWDRMGIDPNPALPSTGGDSVDDDWFDGNHYELSGPNEITPGTDVSTGDPLFIDPANDNYLPSSLSVLHNRIARLVKVDITGAFRADPSTIGAYE